ncbi:MAG: heparinase II/III domain-containing protein [Winogradskyella sp.]
MLQKVSQIFHTVRFLKPIQIYYQVWYRVKKRFFGKLKGFKPHTSIAPIFWQPIISNSKSYSEKFVFSFLNIEHQFKDKIDWNFNTHGKLWTYNLNYFDFLYQENITAQQGLKLINAYVKADNLLKDGKEPYTISLRGINWIKFLSKHNVEDYSINQTLYSHYQILLKNLEYHLLGNHLLENGFSLLFGAYYFKDNQLYRKATQIITAQLNEQILKDGAHFELSPMYHQIIFYRLLDTINLINLNDWEQNNFIDFLKEKAALMLAWLKHITFNNGSIPMLNDSAYAIAPSSNQLIAYAKYLKIKDVEKKLQDSGYRKINKNNLEICADVGNIKPSYQPSHNHADTFSFVCHYNNQPIIVDMGTSTYTSNARRLIERSTKSHNTVTINNENTSKVWSSFRVAQRANVTLIEDNTFKIEAYHNGYGNKYSTNHSRCFDFTEDDLKLTDTIKSNNAEARFHFHPSVKSINIQGNTIKLTTENLSLNFEGEIKKIQIEDYKFCEGFNTLKNAKCVVVEFAQKLQTQICV